MPVEERRFHLARLQGDRSRVEIDGAVENDRA
jgi:hypothetical protein